MLLVSNKPSNMSDIFRNILSHQEVAAIWSDVGRTSFYLEFERALALVQSDLGIVPREAADAIADFCSDVSNIDLEDLRVQTEKIGYPVLGLVKQIVHHVNAKAPGYGEWVHWGATTQDVTDTATVLQLRQTVDIITSSLDAIIIDLRNLADIHKATPMAARSNLQQAVPVTFGFKLARLLCTFQRHHERLLQLKHRLFCQAALAQALKLAAPEIAWHTERDRFAELAGFFALLTGTCAKFALDTKLLMQSEKNPISCAYVSAIATAVRQHATAICEAMVADHERSTGPWEVEWIILPEICTLTGAALKHTQELVAGLQVHPEAMMKNLNITKGGIVAEAVMMGLAPQIGRQVAHDVVYELCRQSAEKNDERVMSGGLSVEQLEQLCDPKNYLGLSVEMVERVLSYE
ncbi:L-Aspartase-like protein [Pisolithus thermaeus]|nr:L-Aspartase-like protein [Pisolithus thermaeus]